MSSSVNKAPPVHTLWLHKKSQNIYVVVGNCVLEATNEPAVLYSETCGNKDVWARSRNEFLDGRFLPIEPNMEAE